MKTKTIKPLKQEELDKAKFKFVEDNMILDKINEIIEAINKLNKRLDGLQ